jgi:hypothetical protein
VKDKLDIEQRDIERSLDVERSEAPDTPLSMKGI